MKAFIHLDLLMDMPVEVKSVLPTRAEMLIPDKWGRQSFAHKGLANLTALFVGQSWIQTKLR